MGKKIIAQCHKVLDEAALIKDIATSEDDQLIPPSSNWRYLHHWPLFISKFCFTASKNCSEYAVNY
jgi:hypothetical protein